ncbi:MAG: hypothetical protein ACYS5V_13245 [Planctomycetota bacterium]|jgi:hypothetical protein
MKLTAFSIVSACCILLIGGAGASGGILLTEGAVTVVDPPPPDARQNQLESSQNIFAWQEQEDLILPSDVEVNIVDAGVYNMNSDLVDGVVSAGTRVKVYFLHADKVRGEGPALIQDARILFSGFVLGIVTKARDLGPSDFLGMPATMYGDSTARGLELGTGSLRDRITLEGNLQGCSSTRFEHRRFVTRFG